ncbi:MAG: superoxide dismutase [Cyclobacteriaceae bacterium]|nr:superoxide dismutase [Cyclobacteriaceae bacterium]
MDRNEFLKTSAIVAGAAALLPTNSVFSQSLQQSGLDRLTDKDGNFALQPLPYNETFLEPSMDQETLHLHYTFHHGDAVKAANTDLTNIKKAIDANVLDTVDYWTKKLSFHLSSHILHTIFWTNLTNKKSDPAGALLKQIEKDFGSYDMLKALLGKTAKGVDGNGWGILGYQPYTQKLTVLQCENHEKLTQWGVIPILVVDVWEHSYYLKYRNRRAEFVDNLFPIINWDNAAERFQLATRFN